MSTTLFTIEVYYLGDPDLKRYVLRNMTTAALKDFREVIISAGLMLPVDPEVKTPGFLGEWIIVLPWNIKSITVYKQSKFYKDADSNKKS